MDIVGALLHSSPNEIGEILSGLLAGAIILSALAMSSAFRRAAFIAGSLLLLYLIVTEGPPGVERLFGHLLSVARKNELFVKGAVAGKILLGMLWQFKPSGQWGGR